MGFTLERVSVVYASPMSVEEMVKSFLEPGTGVKIVPAANVTLALLIMILLISAATWSTSPVAIHLVAMSAIAVLLLITLNWFAHELKKTR